MSEEKNPYIITFAKPYAFEGNEYTEIDLSCLDNMTTENILEAERAWTMKGNAAPQIETNFAFCLELAALATGKPMKFFEKLPKREGIAVKSVVQRDFFDAME